MLRGEEALAAAQPSRLVPRQLSAGIGDFTGRAHEVGVLGELLRTAGAARAVVVCAIAGMGGVGKTTLAVHAAHELAEAFLDGQLQVNLRGIDAPLDPAEVLERFLRVLGVDGSSVPEGVEERAAMYRTRLAGKRMLILLDNAAGEQQVRPLLPGTPGCAVLITSRVRLAGLEGAHHLDLAVLEPDQALGLLAHVVGAERLALDPAAAAEIARLCGHLPLGIRIAGARLAAHPLWPLGRMARLLDDERRRLDELNVGDLGVRASLGLSYEGLATGARRLYRLLGTLTTPDFAGWAAAALLDAGHEQTDAHLAALVEARLLDDAGIDATGQPRYRFHDLVRLHAKERADEEEPPGAARAAVIRALATWLGLAEQADRRLPGRIFEPRRGDAPRRLPPPELTGGLLAEPLAWFSAERAALRAAVQQAAGLDLAGLCWELANAAVNFHDLSDHYDDWESATRTGLTTCERSGDRRGQAVMLRNLAQWSRFSPVNADAMALEEAHAALRPFRELGDLTGEVDALVLISGAHLALGDPAQAMEAGAEAGAKARAHGYALGQAEAGYLMGFCHRVLTQFEQAGEELERGMRLAAGAGLTHQLARLLALLGVVRREQGRYAEAQEHLAGGIALARQLGNRAGEINLQVNLGITHLASSDPRARQVLETSLSLARRGNSTFDEALSLRGLGELELREGRYDAARENTSAALAMWRDLGSPYQEAQSLKILGQVHAAAGRPQAAGAAWTNAVALFQKIGNEAETAAVTALLAKRPP
ncbi:ATP-binding protein [Nonomuraea basaltis]|uniref:ATP-binding protein n=1 Tax=Nonomuraea basaltis TaxID=2495887 RepID=UPI0030B80965